MNYKYTIAYPAEIVREKIDPYGILRLAGIVALVLFCGIAFAQKGSFEIRSASSRLFNGVYLASAHVDLELSDEALEALESGVVLPVKLRVELTRARRMWLDKEIATLEQHYQLSYQPISQRYVVKNLNSGEQDSFATLFSALSNLGRVVDLPIIDAALVRPSGRNQIALRMVLDQTILPTPLRILALWTDGYKLQSDWYVWKLEE
jgi:hypothetical protein